MYTALFRCRFVSFWGHSEGEAVSVLNDPSTPIEWSRPNPASKRPLTPGGPLASIYGFWFQWPILYDNGGFRGDNILRALC